MLTSATHSHEAVLEGDRRTYILEAKIFGVGLAAGSHEDMVDPLGDCLLAASVLDPQGQLAILPLRHLGRRVGGVQVEAAQGVLVVHELPALLVKPPQR